MREWTNNSRLEGFGRIIRDIKPMDAEQQEVLMRIKRASQAAFDNLPRLLRAR